MQSEKMKVAFISQPEYFRCFYENDLDDLFQVREFKLNYLMAEDDFRDLIDYQADFNVFFRGEFCPGGVLARIKGIKVNLSSEPFPRELNGRWAYTRDSLNRYRSFRSLIRNKKFDYVFHYEPASLPLMERDGLRLSGSFAFPVATGTYRRKEAEKKWDIFFIGRSTAHREEWFESLKHKHNFLHIAHGLWGGGLVDYLCASRVCLNMHAEDELTWEPRVQMMISAGAFVISETLLPNDYLRPGVDYVEVSGAKEMEEAVGYYLRNGAEREKISMSGEKRVREVLDARAVFSGLFKDLGQGAYPTFMCGPTNRAMSGVLGSAAAFQGGKSIILNIIRSVRG